MGRRAPWQEARKHLTLVADGGLMMPGDAPQVFRTAVLPDGVPIKLWDQCECDYVPPAVGGKPVPQKLDPAFAEWSEEPPRVATTKRSLRLVLTSRQSGYPAKKGPGGLLGPDGYAIGHFHSGDSRAEQPGFPDLHLWTPLGKEIWELKQAGKVPTLPQAVHMTHLEHSGYTVRLVRPCCLLSGWVDRWLGALSGRPPAVSPWAPQAGRPELDVARERRTPAQQHPVNVTPARRLRTVPDPPGQALDETVTAAGSDRATGYLVPMPGERSDLYAVNALEGWLREHGFAPICVPWPMRITVTDKLLIVWANTGSTEPGKARAWRVACLNTPFPHALAAALRADVVHAPSIQGALGLLQEAHPNATISKE